MLFRDEILRVVYTAKLPPGQNAKSGFAISRGAVIKFADALTGLFSGG
jgi:hypothetical protein